MTENNFLTYGVQRMNHHPVQYSCSSMKSNAKEEILYPFGPIALRSQVRNELSTLRYDYSILLFVRMMRIH